MNKFFKKTLILLISLYLLVAFSAHSKDKAAAANENSVTEDVNKEKLDKKVESQAEDKQSQKNTAEDKKEAANPEKLEDKQKESTKASEAEDVEEVEHKIKRVANVNIVKLLSGNQKLVIEGVEINKPRLKSLYGAFKNDYILFKNGIQSEYYSKVKDLFKKASENGLFSDEFEFSSIKKLLKSNDKYSNAKADILASNLVVKFIDEIANGKKIPKTLEAQFYPGIKPRIVDFVQPVIDFKNADDVELFVNNISPKHEQYFKLKEALKKLLASRKDIISAPKIPDDNNYIVVGARDYRIPLIRQKLGVKKSLNPTKASKEANLYDQALKTAVIDFQKKFDINEEGAIGSKTIRALNISLNDKEVILKANMERYRWLSDRTPKKRIEVNIPSYNLAAYDNNENISNHAIIVGRKEKKTALMETNLYGIVLNPFWHVPRNYALQQLMPILRNDKRYLDDQEFDVLVPDKDTTWKKIDHTKINWNKINDKNYNYLIRQRPGRKNVLGAIKFNINNTYDIYLHSTTEPWLFTNKFKAFSSGCIRVDRPDELAKWMLKDNTSFDMNKFDSIYHAYDNEDPSVKKPNMVNVALTKPLPSFITYFTAKVNDAGEVEYFDDLYRWDSMMFKAWKNI
jgi:murein L,D-transpeptidase YcbB/YkuD